MAFAFLLFLKGRYSQVSASPLLCLRSLDHTEEAEQTKNMLTDRLAGLSIHFAAHLMK